MNKRIFFHLLIILSVGLLPILWLPGDKILAGHDAGIALDPIVHFLDRLSVWSQRLGIGTDQSYALLGAIFIHGIEALLTWVGFSFKQQQIIQFIFWLALPGFTMYFLARNLWPSKKYLPLIAAVIYMLNYYLIQAWFVAERTKFSIYAALPLVMYFTISYFNRKMSLLTTVVLTGVTLSILNGGGSFPLYGGLIIAVGILLIYQNAISFNKQIIIKTILFIAGVSIVYVFLNAYWMISYVYYLFGFFGRDLALAGGPAGALSWTTYLSKGTTFINLFRGQGIPDWYLNTYHPFAKDFLTNPFLILGSFLFPILAYLPLLIVKDKKDRFYIYLFTLISLVTLIFASGPRSQLGAFYEIIARYVPGFAIFRSAFYKFNYSLWFAYALLIGFSLDFIFSKLETIIKAKKGIIASLLPGIFTVLFVVVYLLYHYPVLNGVFLDYSDEPGKELTTRISIPNYVFEFGKWMNQQDSSKRYLVVPELSDTGFISYKWGYWSAAPINSVMIKNSFVQNTFIIPQGERFLTLEMYKALVGGDITSFKDLTEVFAIDGIVLQEDFDWDNISWGTTNPQIYRKILDTSKEFRFVKAFGKWRVYDIVRDDYGKLRVTATSKLSFLQGKLENVASFPFFDPRSPLFIGDLDRNNAEYFAKVATDVFVAPECVACDLKPEYLGFNYYNPKVLAGSVLYPLILYREERIKKNAKDFKSLLNHYLTVSDRRIVEAKWMVDSKAKIEFLQIPLDGYYKALTELINLVNSDWGLDGKEENIAAQTINAHILQQVLLIDSIYESDLLNIDHRKILAQSYEEILKIKQEADKRQWVTSDINDKRYIFDLPKTGSYEIYVKKKSLSNPDGKISGSKIIFKDNPAILRPIGEQDSWISFGKIDLKQTKLRLALQDGTLSNLLAGVSPQFPDGTQGISVSDSTYAMNLESRNKCIAFTANGLETVGTTYLVSFNYRNLTDKKDLGFFINQQKETFPKLHIRESLVPNSRAWANHIQQVIPKFDSLVINFCNGFVSISQRESVKEKRELELLSPGQNLIEIRDVALYKIASPNIVFYQNQSQETDENYVSNYKKTSTVEYKVNVKSVNKPVTLVMRESFGKYWQFCEAGKRCLSFDDKLHFASAGFTNAWYVKDGIYGDVNLYYFPQKTYMIGAYLTIVCALIIAGGTCWILLRKK